MSVTPSFVYKSEMGFSHGELIKGLASAVEPYVLSCVATDNYAISCENRVANLYLGPEKIRKIASLQLPVTQIAIEFENFSEGQRTEFLEKFKKYLHRGGG